MLFLWILCYSNGQQLNVDFREAATPDPVSWLCSVCDLITESFDNRGPKLGQPQKGVWLPVNLQQVCLSCSVPFRDVACLVVVGLFCSMNTNDSINNHQPEKINMQYVHPNGDFYQETPCVIYAFSVNID